jgi:hypothetical protein
MSPDGHSRTAIKPQLEPIITREIAGIAAIDSAIPRESAPDYVAMFQAAKNSKQANVEQMVTLIRMLGGAPPEGGGIRRTLMQMQTALSARVSTTMTLRAMQVAEVALVTLYTTAAGETDGVARRGLGKALGRALVRAHVLTAHLARRTGAAADLQILPFPLPTYFVGPEPRACMRCHLDRPGSLRALERRDSHPYTYICAACHDEVITEMSPDLATQLGRWPPPVREARVMQHALSRVSKLNAIGQVLHPLAGLDPLIPLPAAERADVVPTVAPTPGPAAAEQRGTLVIGTADGPEGEYIDRLFSRTGVWESW